ncbi:hypothetical protein JVT61DRAFT_13859 [Boletus reticuloceps]|uniref:Uncharacterized protein n=1 Tax=Boletus reticuloceps TaxID=495285 RepID=A0A8I2YSA1_9AGAM|nr:hypothetical protein JVT61DRAFT_13859 [Boletus reticuloceps]
MLFRGLGRDMLKHSFHSDRRPRWVLSSAATVPTLKELFAKGDGSTGIPPSFAYKITAIDNTWWKEFFTNNMYFIPFAFDPRYPLADFLIKASLAPPTFIIPACNPASKPAMTNTTSSCSIPHLRAFERAKNLLKQMLQYSERTQIGPAAVVEEFRNQFEPYWCNEWPFNVLIVDSHPYA